MSAANRRGAIKPRLPVKGRAKLALLHAVTVISGLSAVSAPISTGSGSSVYPAGALTSVIRYCAPTVSSSHLAIPSAPVVMRLTSVHELPSGETSSSSSVPERGVPVTSTLYTVMLPVSSTTVAVILM